MVNIELSVTSFNTIWNDLCLSDHEVAVQGDSMAFQRSHDYTVSYTDQGRGVLEQLGLCEEPLHTLDQRASAHCSLEVGSLSKHSLQEKEALSSPMMDFKGSLDPPYALPQQGGCRRAAEARAKHFWDQKSPRFSCTQGAAVSSFSGLLWVIR